MKRSLFLLIALVIVAAMAGSVYAQDFTGPQVTTVGQIGTPEVQRGLDVSGQKALLTKRVGVLAYCADIAPRAAAVGIFSWPHQPLEVFPAPGQWGNPDALPTGHFGAQNIVDMLMYDDEIPRFRDVVLIDGDRALPSAADLIQNFDCVIAYTDNKCGNPIPNNVANNAASALASFANAGRGVVLTGFAFNQRIGFGGAPGGIFNAALSPFTKTSPAAAPQCSPPGDVTNPSGFACPIGRCADPATLQLPVGVVNPSTDRPVNAPECVDCTGGTNIIDLGHLDAQGNPLQFCACDPAAPINASNFCGTFVNPTFDNITMLTNDRVCESLFQGVSGPTSASLANDLTVANVTPTATVCANYNNPNTLPLIAVNAARNVVGLNVFPATAEDLRKTWFSCILANAAIWACGERRCIPDPDDPSGTICK